MAHDIAVFVGRLIGSMLNPVVILVTLGTFIGLNRHPYWIRLVAALGAVLVAGTVLYSFDHYLTLPEKTQGTAFGLLSAAVWFVIFAAIDRFRRRQG